MQALEYGLRTLPKAFALIVKLTQNFEARFFLWLPTLNRGELFLQACDKLLMQSQLLGASLNRASTMIEFVLEILSRRACSAGLPLDSRACGLDIGNRGIQTAPIFLCR